MPILKVKDKATGQWVQVGVSTEATGAQIAAHNASPDAHADIRQAITKAGTDLTAHNVSTSAHADIRQAIAELNAASVSLAAAQENNMEFVISTVDLQDGVSGLDNNKIYLVYE